MEKGNYIAQQTLDVQFSFPVIDVNSLALVFSTKPKIYKDKEKRDRKIKNLNFCLLNSEKALKDLFVKKIFLKICALKRNLKGSKR